jgi:hypothetical protein
MQMTFADNLRELRERATDTPWSFHQSHIYAPDGNYIAVIHNPGAKESDYPIEDNRNFIAFLANHAEQIEALACAAERVVNAETESDDYVAILALQNALYALDKEQP